MYSETADKSIARNVIETTRHNAPNQDIYDDSEVSSKARSEEILGKVRQKERKRADKMHMQRERNKRIIEKHIRS